MSDVQEKEQPKTKIISLKLGGDWDYNVTFQQTFQKQKIQTNDRPLDSMTAAIQQVVTKALDYFKLYEVLATFESITFGDTEDGDGKFSIVLSIKPRDNQYIWIKAGVSSISRRQMLEEDTLEAVRGFIERNELNDAVDFLEEEIKKYALGQRLQQELPIEEPDDENYETTLDSQIEFSMDDTDDSDSNQKSSVIGGLVEAGRKLFADIKNGSNDTNEPASSVINVDFTSSEAVQK